MDRLLALISSAESPRLGYDSVNLRARTKPPKRPTEMTIAEIFAWIEATPNQPHAIGRFLVAEAGYAEFTSGRITRATFMDNLARVWAGFPLSNGRHRHDFQLGVECWEIVHRCRVAAGVHTLRLSGRALWRPLKHLTGNTTNSDRTIECAGIAIADNTREQHDRSNPHGNASSAQKLRLISRKIVDL